MKYAYFARQPIMDSEKRTVGYELLFRNSQRNVFPDVDGEYATHLLLSNYFLGSGPNLLGNKLGAVNFPYQSLLDRIPTMFPSESLMIDILEDCPPTGELLEAVRELSDRGYKIALDNFIPNKAWKEFLPHIHLIRFDIHKTPVSKAAPFINLLRGTKIKFLAEKVETYEEFVRAKRAGFKFFQGYFFRKPEMIQQKEIQASFFTVVQLCKAIAKKEVDYEEVENIITADVTLSYKLLRYVNSTSTITTEVKSFRQALAYLGEERLRRFVSLVAISTVKGDKPDSLYSLSLQRAKFCELICETLAKNAMTSQAFLVGLFSLLDSLLDQSLEDIMASVPVEKEVKQALLEREGFLGDILSLVVSYESAEWEQVDILAEKLGLIAAITAQSYEDSILWVEELLSDIQVILK